jgi:hypothetical protein
MTWEGYAYSLRAYGFDYDKAVRLNPIRATFTMQCLVQLWVQLEKDGLVTC